MAIVLLNSQFLTALQTESQFALASLLWINDTTIFPNPFTVAAVKTALEAAQAPNVFTTENFNQYLTRIYTLGIDTSFLTLSEVTRYNIIREYLQPPPNLDCCGVILPDGTNTVVLPFEKIGSVTFEYELQIVFDASVDCEIDHIKVTITPQFGSPAVTTPATFTCNNLGCINGKWVFSKLWVDFVSSPTGFLYDFMVEPQNNIPIPINSYNILSVGF